MTFDTSRRPVAHRRIIRIARVAREKSIPALPVLVWVISTVLMGWKPCKKGVCV
jgi:hypothetical protein